MSKINGAAFALLLVAATPAAAQSPAMAPDASARKSVQPAAAASNFTIEEKGVKRTTGAPVANVKADPATLQRGNGANAKPHTNSGDSNPEGAAALRGKPTKDQFSSVDKAEGAAALHAGKPTKDQVTVTSPGSGNARMTSPIVNSNTARTPGAMTAPGSATPGVDASGNKSFFESRSNTARSPTDSAAAAAPATAAAAKGSAAGATAPQAAAPGAAKSIFKD